MAPGGRPGMVAFGSNTFFMRGGYLYINAEGDGLDINGPVEMSDGVIIINGPTVHYNGALDYTGSFDLAGGYLLAVGSAGMAQMPSGTSTQNSLMIRFSTSQQANCIIHIQNADGADIMTFKPVKSFQSIVLSSPLLKQGDGYSFYQGGGSTGVERDGLFIGGAYYGGVYRGSFSISGVLTSLIANW
jgi:hypothetical protein